jgi:hypothetical protein
VDVVHTRPDLVRVAELAEARSSSMPERLVSMVITSAFITAISGGMSLNSE